jgi:hypothetical protein
MDPFPSKLIDLRNAERTIEEVTRFRNLTTELTASCHPFIIAFKLTFNRIPLPQRWGKP